MSSLADPLMSSIAHDRQTRDQEHNVKPLGSRHQRVGSYIDDVNNVAIVTTVI